MTNAEIQVGVNEYVRTKNKGIKRIDRIEDNKTVNKYLYFIGYDHNDKEYGVIKTTEILKHSFNLIDLIEAGDYVNGQKVYDIEKAENIVTKKKCVAINMQNLGSTILYEKSVKSIVTKEQFKSVEYEVGEDDKC